MQSRFEQRSGVRRVEQVIGSQTTSVIQIVPLQYDTFTVLDDYTGPKQLNVVHKHRFRRSLYTEYSGRETTLIHPNRIDTTSGQGIRGFTRHSQPGFGFAPDPDLNTLYNTALSRVYDQIRGSVDLAVSVAEAGRTRDSVRQWRDQLLPIADDLSRHGGRLVRFIRNFHPRQWGNRWLEYQYGWRPLVQDIYNTAQQLMDSSTKRNLKIVGRASQQRGDLTRYANTWYTGCTESVGYALRSRVMVVAEFGMSPSRIQALSGFTSLNPASITWELLPYSFVVDWFYDIGGYIRNLESNLLFMSDLKRAYMVEGYRLLFTGSVDGGGPQNATTTSVASARASALYTYKHRQVTTLAPRYPVVRADLGWQRLISAASLLSQFLGR